MTLALLFWILMLAWLLFGGVMYWPRAAPPAPTGGWTPLGYSLLLWFILFLLGVGIFGFPIKG